MPGNGILVKKSEILENASKVNTIIFDKTGTLTYGKLKVSKIYNYSNFTDEEIFSIARSIEAKSSHPIGKAFTDYIYEHKLEQKEVSEFENITGYGIVGKIAENTIILGNKKIVQKYNIENRHVADEEKLSEAGNSVV